MENKSLKKQLYSELSRFGYLSLKDIRAICENGEKYYKLETAERRLREMPNVIPIKNDKGHNIGYKLIRGEVKQTSFL